MFRLARGMKDNAAPLRVPFPLGFPGKNEFNRNSKSFRRNGESQRGMLEYEKQKWVKKKLELPQWCLREDAWSCLWKHAWNRNSIGRVFYLWEQGVYQRQVRYTRGSFFPTDQCMQDLDPCQPLQQPTEAEEYWRQKNIQIINQNTDKLIGEW